MEVFTDDDELGLARVGKDRSDENASFDELVFDGIFGLPEGP